MKNTAILFMMAGLGLAGCAEYQPSEANCFDGVTRSSYNMAFMAAHEPAPRARISTKSAGCIFTPLSGPEVPSDD